MAPRSFSTPGRKIIDTKRSARARVPLKWIMFHVAGTPPPLPPPPPPTFLVKSASFIRPLSSRFTSQLPSGKPVAPITDDFLPPAFAVTLGMAAVFTRARSGKLWIPHPHDMCITGHEGQGFLGEDMVLIPAGKQQAFWGNWANQSKVQTTWRFFRLSTHEDLRLASKLHLAGKIIESPSDYPLRCGFGPPEHPLNFPPSSRNNVGRLDEFHVPFYWVLT